MKYKKNYYGTNEDHDDEDYSEFRKGNKRRPIRNWTKVYTEHSDEADEIDDFYSNHKSYR
jgi:hypothetical protein